MRKLQFLTRTMLAVVVVVAVAMSALAFDDDDQGASPDDDVCVGLSDGAKGLCNAYCSAQDCPSHPAKHSCSVLRTNFQRQTGSSTFPCDDATNVTATPSSTRTVTALPPTRTPTDTPAATASLTATAASTSTATAPATATATGSPDFTRTPSETATAISTATATAVGVPTGTAAAASCAEVGGGAEFVCETFCGTEQCPSNPTPFCEELRAILLSRTGSSIFPCEAPVGTLSCMGDCGGDGTVDISDLTQCLLIVLGERDASACAGARQDGQPMTIGDMVTAVHHALDGCD